MAMIEADHLTKRYENGRLAVDAVSFSIAPGEIYCLLGANGAGKTTVANMFLGFVRPTFGEARLNGVDVLEDAIEAKRHVAYLTGGTSHYASFTARRNLQYFSVLGGRRNVNRQDCHDAMRRVGLPERCFERKVREFSDGMRRKLGLAACILKKAPALIIDDPLAGLDPKAAHDLIEILHDLREEGRAILLAMNDLFRARELADRVGILMEGRKVLEFTREDLRFETLERIHLGYMGGDAFERAAIHDS